MKDLILGWIGFAIVFGLFIFIVGASVGDEPVGNECGEGYHWEEDFRQTIGGCVHD